MRADFIPDEKGEKIHKDVVYEKEQFPEDVTEKGIELNAAPATRLHMKDFLAAVEKRSKPVADIQEGHTSTASCILANVSMALGGRPLVYDPAKRQVVGDAVPPVFGLKGATGHTLGACGVLEAVACALAIRGGYLPGTPGFSATALGLDVVARSRATAPRRLLTVNAGFGGLDAALVLEG